MSHIQIQNDIQSYILLILFLYQVTWDSLGTYRMFWAGIPCP